MVTTMGQPVKQVSKEFVLSALRNGLTDTQIAESLGVTPSAIAQLVDNYGLREQAALNSQFHNIDQNYNYIEEEATKRLKKHIGLIVDPMKLLHVIRTVNAAKRRSMAEGASVNNTNNVQLISLNLPEHLKVDVIVNAKNQVAAVEGRELVTMPSGKLMEEATGKDISNSRVIESMKDENENGNPQGKTKKVKPGDWL